LGLARPADGAFVVILAGDAALERISFAHFIPNGLQRYNTQTDSKVQDFVVLQVIVLILLICSAAIGWVISGKLDRILVSLALILVVILVTLSFIGGDRMLDYLAPDCCH